MINDAEKFVDEYKKVKELIEAENEPDPHSLKNQDGDIKKPGVFDEESHWRNTQQGYLPIRVQQGQDNRRRKQEGIRI